MRRLDPLPRRAERDGEPERGFRFVFTHAPLVQDFFAK